MLAQLLALFLAAAPQTAPIESRALALFDAQCSTLDSTDALMARIRAAGWQPYDPAGTPLAALLAYHANEQQPGWKLENWAFAQGADRSLILVVTRAGRPDNPSVECRVFAPGMKQPPSIAIVETWAGTAPKQKFDHSGVLAWEWSPGLRASHSGGTAVLYIAPDSPMLAQFKSPGLMIAAQR
jgi:hypothetical protein